MNLNTVKFGDKDSYKDFGLILESKQIGLPEIKPAIINAPGISGIIDLTEVIADDVLYGQRLLKFRFWLDEDRRDEWESRETIISNFIHGKRHRVVLSWDNIFYYDGRCSVTEFDTSGAFAYITIEVEAQPYKVDMTTHTANWLWDPFSFVDGIIYPSEIIIDGVREVNLPSRRKVVSPTFTASSSMTVEHAGKVYEIPANKPTTVYGIRLKEGDNLITVKGSGTLQVEYEGGAI